MKWLIATIIDGDAWQSLPTEDGGVPMEEAVRFCAAIQKEANISDEDLRHDDVFHIFPTEEPDTSEGGDIYNVGVDSYLELKQLFIDEKMV